MNPIESRCVFCDHDRLVHPAALCGADNCRTEHVLGFPCTQRMTTDARGFLVAVADHVKDEDLRQLGLAVLACPCSDFHPPGAAARVLQNIVRAPYQLPPDPAALKLYDAWKTLPEKCVAAPE